MSFGDAHDFRDAEGLDPVPRLWGEEGLVKCKVSESRQACGESGVSDCTSQHHLECTTMPEHLQRTDHSAHSHLRLVVQRFPRGSVPG